MPEKFIQWTVAKFDEDFGDEARIQFLSMLKHTPEKVKDYIRNRLTK